MSAITTHAQVVIDRASEESRRSGDEHDPSPASKRPSAGEFLRAVVPLIFFVPVAGPPAILLLGPLLLLVLLLIPPAALLITFGLVVVVGAVLVIALGALIASPYLLVRHLHARHRAARPGRSGSEDPGVRGRQTVVAGLVHLTNR